MRNFVEIGLVFCRGGIFSAQHSPMTAVFRAENIPPLQVVDAVVREEVHHLLPLL